jgi:cytochrome c5
VNPEHHDKTFVVTFLAVLGFLGAFTVAIIAIANSVGANPVDDAEALARLEERIRPAGEVITDEKMLLAAAPPPAAAARAPMSGAEIVAKVCNACHGTGVLNAPKTGDKAAFAARGDLAALVAGAIKGKNAMPPRGGDPSLSDAEVKAAVQEMIK